jgi:CxxC motif-containing protein (DUF1111 family)
MWASSANDAPQPVKPTAATADKGLADNVSQGSAGGDQFRTAPLWGLGQRILLLHDGRTTNLLTEIQAHASQRSDTVEENFFNLSFSQQQEVLNFLR